MKKDIKVANEFSSEALLVKAMRYSETMFKHDQSSWEYAFWSALTLEMVLRASIANISPVLIAENKDWQHIYFALGHKPNIQKYSPKSATTSELIRRAMDIFPGFTKELANFCSSHTERRNAEVHSGSLPFDLVQVSEWQAQYYASLEVLLKSMKKNLGLLLTASELKTAKYLIKGFNDQSTEFVKSAIATYKAKWDKLKPIEKAQLSSQSTIQASRHKGHRVKCPACKSDSLIKGRGFGEPSIDVTDQLVIVKVKTRPSHFECFACGLKIHGYSKLHACGLGAIYTSRSSYDPVDYFGAPIENDEWDGMEDDNNEPW